MVYASILLVSSCMSQSHSPKLVRRAFDFCPVAMSSESMKSKDYETEQLPGLQITVKDEMF